MNRFLRVVDPLFRVGVLLLTAGVVFGLVAAATGGFSLTAGWLIAAYLVVAVIYAIGFAVGVPWFKRVGAAAQLADEGGSREELDAALRDPRGVFLLVSGLVLYPLVIFLMVTKPF